MKLPEVQKLPKLKIITIYHKLKFFSVVSYLLSVHKAILPNAEGWENI
jgi:hypothetical protein